ncbi:MAG: amidohydrolase family protein [Planctomycetes bacterium]|nr:amidohydrolase family protein [Planctomycetota bacterium]
MPNRAGNWTLRLAEGRIKAIEPFAAETAAGGSRELDAAGGLLTPRLVDPHLHLDLAYSLDIVEENQSGTLLEAIGLWTEAKKHIQSDDVRERALRAIREEVRFGTGLIRSHVDVASASQMRLCEGVLAAREATRDYLVIQLVAFPQDGLIRDPKAVDLIRSAIRAGVDLIGGIPHIERTQPEGIAHLEQVFDLAAEFDADVDVHIDETDDPASRYTEHLAALTIQRGWQGRVTASHVCALASYDDVHASRVMDLIAEADIKVVTNPGVNLHLQGRFDGYPKRRGLTRISELLQRGVTCAAGQDCIRDPFYPLGNGKMLDQAFLLAHAEHMASPTQIKQAFDMICGKAADLMRIDHHALEVGAPANLLLFEAGDVAELVRMRPTPRHVIRHAEMIEI